MKSSDGGFLAMAGGLAALSLFAATQHMSHSVWLDESQTVDIARQPTLATLVKQTLQERPYPPLFFIAVRQSLRFNDDEAHLRWPAAVFGAMATVAVFLMGSALTDAATGFVAALLFVLTPGMFRYFVDGNAYTLLALCSALALAYLFKAVQRDNSSDWMLYALFSVLGLATHSIFVFCLLGHGLTGLALRVFARSSTTASWKRFVATMSVVGSVALLWIYLSLTFGSKARPLHTTPAVAAYSIVAAAAMYLGPLSFGNVGMLAIWGVLQVLGIVALFRHSRYVFWFVALVSAATLLPTTLFLLSTIPYVAYRYGLGIFPLACVVAASAPKLIADHATPVRFPWPAAVKTLAFAAILSYSLNGAIFLATSGGNVFEYQDWRSAARFLNDQVGPDEIVFHGRRERLPLGYYYRGSGKMIALSDFTDAAAAVSRALTDPSGTRAWIVISTTENDNPVVAKYTEKEGGGLEQQVRSVTAELQRRGFSADVAARFHRIDVVVARR